MREALRAKGNYVMNSPFFSGTSKLDRIQIAAEAVNLTLTREEWFRIWCAGVGRVSVP